jgi:hypothetical protein
VARRPADREKDVEILGAMTRRAAEALQLEIRRLARRYDIDIEQIRIERPEEQRRT